MIEWLHAPSLIILGTALLAGWVGWSLGRKGRALDLERLNWSERRNQELLEQQQYWEQRARETFASSAADILQRSQSHLVEVTQQHWSVVADQMERDWQRRAQKLQDGVQPVTEAMVRLEQKILDVERKQHGAYEGLQSKLQSMLSLEQSLQKETAKLSQALRAPQVRGRWGEVQLRRVVELAGMLEYCDFDEQRVVNGGESRYRPDLVVKLPGGRALAIDSKVPLDAYLQAQETEDEAQRRTLLNEHAKRVRQHVAELSKKAYWEHLTDSPEFVILFLPGEPFYAAALQADPTLLEVGSDNRVLIATPTTLIALLRAAAFGWQQEKLSQHASAICQLGKELHKRMLDMLSHWSKSGKALEDAVKHYNRAVGSLESRVLVTARKFQEMQSGDEIPEPEQIDTAVRPINLN